MRGFGIFSSLIPSSHLLSTYSLSSGWLHVARSTWRSKRRIRACHIMGTHSGVQEKRFTWWIKILYLFINKIWTLYAQNYNVNFCIEINFCIEVKFWLIARFCCKIYVFYKEFSNSFQWSNVNCIKLDPNFLIL